MSDHVGYEISEGVEPIQDFHLVKAPYLENHCLVILDDMSLPFLASHPEIDVPFKLKGERNPRGGWMNIVREKDHSGGLELVYLDEEESKEAEKLRRT